MPIPSSMISAIVAHQNLVFISSEMSLQVFDIRLKVKICSIKLPKKCISLCFDSAVSQIIGGCENGLLIFKLKGDRVTLEGYCDLPSVGEIF